jgi:hypothetical protein
LLQSVANGILAGIVKQLAASCRFCASIRNANHP